MLAARVLIFMVMFSFLGVPSLHSAGMEEYLQGLLDKNNQVKSYEAKRRQAKEKLWQAKSRYLPQVNLHSQANKENIDREHGRYTHMDRSYINVRSTQLVTDFGKTSAGIDKAQELLRRAELQLNMVRKKVLLEGVTAYLQVLQAKERLRYARRSEKNIKEQTGMEKTLVRKGAGLSSDVLQARSQLAGARALRIRAEGELEMAMNRFQAVFHTRLEDEELAAMVKPDLPGEKLPETRREAVRKALKDNPKLLVLEKALEAAGEEVDIQEGNLLPRINLFAAMEYKENDSGIRGYRKDTRGGIELSCDLFKSGGDWAAYKAAREKKTSKLKNLKYQRKQVQKKARNDWNSFRIQTKNHEHLQNQARIASEFLEMAKKERKLGNRSLLDILSGETEYIRSVSDAVSADISRRLAAYKLLYTTGDLTLKTIR